MGCMTCATATFSFFFWLIGGSMLGAGVWFMVDAWAAPYQYRVLTGQETYWDVTVYALIAAGGLVILAGLLGCIGACTSQECVLVVYGILVGLAIIAEIAITVFPSIIFFDGDSVARSNMLDHVKGSYVDEYSEDPVTVAINRMQLKLKCCGAYSFMDYRGSTFEQNPPLDVYVPWTCCVLRSGVDYRDAVSADLINYSECQREASPSPPSRSQYLHANLVALGISCCLLSSKQKVSPESRAI